MLLTTTIVFPQSSSRVTSPHHPSTVGDVVSLRDTLGALRIRVAGLRFRVARPTDPAVQHRQPPHISVPLNFATQGGWKTFRAVEEGLDSILDDGSSKPLIWRRKEDGEFLNVDSDVEAGDFIVHRDDPTLATPALLPDFPRKPTFSDNSAASSVVSDKSSVSDKSDRSRTFRESLVWRDEACCVVTEMRNHCEAARLIPKGDRDGFALANVPYSPYSVVCGVLLWVPLQCMYDSYEAAFFPKVDQDTGVVTFTFHIFMPPWLSKTEANRPWVDLLQSLHGTVITWNPTMAPQANLARVHYQRTLGKRFAKVRRVVSPPMPSAPGTPTPPTPAKRPASPTVDDITRAQKVGRVSPLAQTPPTTCASAGEELV